MKFCTLKDGSDQEHAAILVDKQWVTVAAINQVFDAHWPTTLFQLIDAGLSPLIYEQACQVPDRVALDAVRIAPLYRRPRKIIGIGLNYLNHAKDLGAPHPTEPASFMKGDNTIIGYDDSIVLPKESNRVTAEAEIAVVIGRACHSVSEEAAVGYIAGYCLVIDMTAEDILLRNPRFLTKSKNFDSFFSFGPELVTPDEITDLMSLTVATWKNGSPHRENTVSNMAFNPLYLVSHFSHISTLYPGDVISTGTPGATVIESGDQVECRVTGFRTLTNRVV